MFEMMLFSLSLIFSEKFAKLIFTQVRSSAVACNSTHLFSLDYKTTLYLFVWRN